MRSFSLLALAAAASAIPTPDADAAAATQNPSNPALNAHEFADPRSIKVGSKFYAFATNQGGSNGTALVNVPAASSDVFDASGWSLVEGYDALPNPGAWTAKAAGDGANVWDPAVFQYANDSFVMYYAAVGKTSNGENEVHCIGVATSSTILGTYTPQAEALLCPGNGVQAISPNPFLNDGKPYIVYKRGNGNNSVIELRQLAADGTAFAAGTTAIPLHQTTGNEVDSEGPTIITNPTNGHYMLLFVTGFYENDNYAIQYASSKTLVPASGATYDVKGVLLQTGKTNGVQLYAPGGPDFPNKSDPYQMTFMTFDQPQFGTRVMRTATVAYTTDDVMSLPASS